MERQGDHCLRRPLRRYLNDLNPFDFGAVERTIEWNAVIAWRIATYYVPIGVT